MAEMEAESQDLASSAVWITAEGEPIRVSDMTDSHLSNTIKYLQRKATKRSTEIYHRTKQHIDPIELLQPIYFIMATEFLSRTIEAQGPPIISQLAKVRTKVKKHKEELQVKKVQSRILEI